MEKSFIIGREGNQPFTISQEGVSREHAKLTIDDNGKWTLEDLNSGNGTFIRNEEGDLEQIGKKTISERTYICLGPDNINGCKFYARQLIAPKDYQREFDLLEEIDNDIEERLDKADDKSKLIRKAIAIISMVGFFGSFIVEDNGIRTMLLRASTAATGASSIFYDPNKQKKQLKALREKLFGCPNPACSHNLSSKEVRNRKCAKCGAKG